MTLRDATPDDVLAIHEVLHANAADRSLFQQSERQIGKTLGDFIVAIDDGVVIGCAALHWHSARNAEILAAVAPDAQSRGTGKRLVDVCVERARGAECLWLATAKPGYFARFGFQRISRWRLPVGVLVAKLRLIFQQPLRRWLPALFGRHTFMRAERTRTRSAAR